MDIGLDQLIQLDNPDADWQSKQIVCLWFDTWIALYTLIAMRVISTSGRFEF